MSIAAKVKRAFGGGKPAAKIVVSGAGVPPVLAAHIAALSFFDRGQREADGKGGNRIICQTAGGSGFDADDLAAIERWMRVECPDLTPDGFAAALRMYKAVRTTKLAMYSAPGVAQREKYNYAKHW